jgi:hypothetical protein
MRTRTRERTLIGLLTIALCTASYNFFARQYGIPMHSWELTLAEMLAWYGLNWINVIRETERRPIFLFGWFRYAAGPGLKFIEPVFYTAMRDVKVQDVPVQIQALVVYTKDSVCIAVDALCIYTIDQQYIRQAIVGVANVNHAVHNRALAALTEVSATLSIDQLLDRWGSLEVLLVGKLQQKVISWGVEVKSFEPQSFRILDREVANVIAMRVRVQVEADAELKRAQMQEHINERWNEAAAKLTEEGWKEKSLSAFLEAVHGPGKVIIVPSGMAEELGRLLPKPGSQAVPNGHTQL